ncbi:MAG: ribosome-associated protein [Candidatus Omnitrophota bacterium]|jgi:ribosome-associated protein
MRGVVNFCDYFVICSGNNDRHLQAIADSIQDGLQENGSKYNFRKAMKDKDWVVLDIGDIVTHVFLGEVREFYGLEHLWQEAKVVSRTSTDTK